MKNYYLFLITLLFIFIYNSSSLESKTNKIRKIEQKLLNVIEFIQNDSTISIYLKKHLNIEDSVKFNILVNKKEIYHDLLQENTKNSFFQKYIFDYNIFIDKPKELFVFEKSRKKNKIYNKVSKNLLSKSQGDKNIKLYFDFINDNILYIELMKINDIVDRGVIIGFYINFNYKVTEYTMTHWTS